MRIGGMASGMDTETIIKDLMKANRIPLDKVTQKKQFLQWQLDDYRSINRNLQATSYKIADTVMSEGAFMAKNVSNSNPDAVSIKSISTTSDFSGTISVEKLATQATWQSTGTEATKGLDESAEISKLISGTSITINVPNSKGELDPKEVKTVTFEPGETIKSALNKINKETGVNAFYDTHSGQIAMTAKNSGKGEIAVTGLVGDGQPGQNAEFTFNGLKTERSSNTFQISGFEVNLKQVTTGDVTFNSTSDTDKIMDSVVQFVDDYNKMIEELNGKIRESKYRDFHPLSAEEKKDMKENEIKLWEEKAMSGTLRSDPTVSSMLNKMRDALNGTVEGTNGPIRLSDIGITTSNNYKDNGKLIIDKDKLRKSVAEDPNKVSELFTKTGTGVNETGLAERFKKVVDEGQKSISKLAGSAGSGNDSFTLGNTIKSMDEQIVRFEDRMKKVEDRLWKNFTAMEQAINRANAQSAGLMSALGGG
ncbi:flagellar cap protein FliD [Sporosarcina sp. ANT_H38]|uniref:flagellar filament capping protein FliD n=1 Tax=Sporosarcina sp. ANT_H38 TaxID=2597358 RepID=UPI0011F22037|nr:flagellar filament capping protein FliD [Sporosarcina sp. ANT_H38]KAA0966775.1 flagellar cap protein FliD [Sporosarcina sp. ANT_H38]